MTRCDMWNLPHACVALATILAACSVGGSGSMASTPTPAPVATPSRFVPLDPAKLVAAADTVAGDGCVSPMVDRARGIQIILVRSDNGIGDYLAPSGSYCIPDGRVLRIECNTGHVLGLVRR